MNHKSLCIREFGEIHQGKINSSENIDKIFLNKTAWHSLEKFTNSANKNHRFLRFKNSKILKVQNFVGVISTTCGTQIEILPKTNTDIGEGAADNSREILVKMLKEINNLNYIETTKANTQNINKLLEYVINIFLQELNKIIKIGIRSDYSQIATCEKFLKGQLQAHKQFNEPPHKWHLFHIKYHIFSPNRAENRLIKSALLQVIKYSKDNQNQKLAKKFVEIFDNVPQSNNYQYDFSKYSKNRDMNYYQTIVPWLKLVLNQQSPFTLKDKNAGISFLIPMEQLFEKYVAKILIKKLPANYKLTEQRPQKYLTKNPDAFSMKPDITIYKNNNLLGILDTKWKLIDKKQKNQWGNVDNKQGISQADMYQLFAYGTKYNVTRVMLIYPEWAGFTNKLTFHFNDNLDLLVMPFSLKNNKISDKIIENIENITKS